MRRDKYPRSVSLWDLPDDIDGALQWDNRRTYFFKQVRRALDHATNIASNEGRILEIQ